MDTRHRPQNHKFSRRIFVLFIISAIIPVAMVAAISYSHVAAQLREQSFEQSRQDSKSIGMELFGRLGQARDRFEDVVQALNQEPGSSGEMLTTTLTHLEHEFSEFVLIKSGRVISGDADLVRLLPMDDADLGQFLADGKTRIIITSAVDSSPKLLMVTRLDKDKPSVGILVATVNQEFIWGVTELLPEGTELVVLSGEGVMLFSNEIGHTTIRDSLRKHIKDGISGQFLVGKHADGYSHLVSYWSLFTSGEFGIPDWVIAVSQPEEMALLALADFQHVYFPLLVAVILAISFFAAMQIRKRVLPLNALIEVTQKVASGDFNERIRVNGDDEIAQLGNSFNIMAQRLDRLFRSLETLADIDQMILASLDTRYIVSTALENAFKLSDCSSVAMVTFDDIDSGVGHFTIRLAGSNAEILLDHNFKHAEMVELLSCHDLVVGVGDENFPAYIPAVVYDGCDKLLLIPLLIEGHLAAVIMFGYSERQWFGDGDQTLLHKFASRIDVALSNARWESRLYQQAHYDALTGLPNRILLIDRLEQVLTRARQDNTCAALFFIDIDRFKVINDSLGHSAGDRLLKLIAMNLAANIRDIDTVVRFGGDEFIIIIPDLRDNERALTLLQNYATKLLALLHENIDINGINLLPEASIGIAVYPENGVDVETLIKNADTAMHSAKDQGRNQFSFYSPDLNREALYRLQLEQELRRAIDNGEFCLHYQPKLSIDGQSLVGAEALIRWQHPQRGLLMPNEFVGLAEESGLIDDMSLWVIRAACLQIREWRNRGLFPLTIAINLSSSHFRDAEVGDIISRTLKECGLDGSALEIEITETAVMTSDVDSEATLRRIRDAGIGITIDDFGTGYSSLSYLHKLPIDKIKIDQSFIMGMIDNQDSRAIVASTIALAHQLRFKVVAEGVETAEVQEMLAQWSCDELQGYYFSKPLPVTEFEQFQHRFQASQSPEQAPGHDSDHSSTG